MNNNVFYPGGQPYTPPHKATEDDLEQVRQYLEDAEEDLRDCMECIAKATEWPRKIALECAVKALTRGKPADIVGLYDSAADIVAEEIAEGKR